MRAHQIFMALGWACLLGSCTPDVEPPAADQPIAWHIEAEPLLEIGAVDGADAYLFDGIAGIGFMANDRLLVANRGSSSLRVFSSDGTLQGEFGREGEGPGEYGRLSAAQVVEGDSIVVFDSDLHRVTYLDSAGELVRSVTLDSGDGSPDQYIGHFPDGGLAALWLKAIRIDPSTTVSDSVRIGRFAGSTLEAVVAEFPGVTRRGSPIPFSPHAGAVVIGTTLFYGSGAGGTVHMVSSDGSPLGGFTLPGSPVPQDEAWARLTEVLTGPAADRAEQLLDAAGGDPLPLYSDMIADPTGFLWVKRYDPATDSHAIMRPRTGGVWVVFDADGAPVTEIAVPDGVRLVTVGSDRVAGVARDDLGVERVVVLTLVRPFDP